MQNLTERVITVVDAVVEEQERTRLALEKNIEDTANAIGQVSAALGKNAPEMPVTADVPLKVLLQRYQEQYAVLRKDKAEAMAQLTAEWKKLHQLWDELGTPRNPADGYEGDANTFDSAKEFSQIDEVRFVCHEGESFDRTSPPAHLSRSPSSASTRSAATRLRCSTGALSARHEPKRWPRCLRW